MNLAAPQRPAVVWGECLFGGKGVAPRGHCFHHVSGWSRYAQGPRGRGESRWQDAADNLAGFFDGLAGLQDVHHQRELDRLLSLLFRFSKGNR